MSNKTIIDVGVVTPVPKDEYNDTIAYERLNIVSFNGSSYMAKQNTTGHLPTDTTYWMLLAKKGDQGPDVAVVTQPIITGMNDVVAGSPSTYEVQSTSLLVGNSISRFDYRVGSGTTQSVNAVNGRADIQVTVPSDVSVGTTVPLFVTAYDKDGHSNYNQKNLDVVTPVIAVPTVTGVISGSTNVGINPTITVSAFSVYPSGYDTAKQVRYKLFNGTTNLLIEESTREINSNGGSFTLNNLLSVNTKYRIEVWWEGNKISSDKYISTFTTLNAFITAPVLSVKTDTASTALRPQITVGSFVVSPNGFDTPKNLTYEIRLKSNNSIIDSGTKSISSSGGAFTPNKDLILNTNYVIKAKWVGNIIESPYTSKDFKTIDAFITAPTINTPLSASTDNLEVVTFDLSDFVVIPTGFDTHVSTTVEVYTDAGMTNLSATVTKTTGDLTSVDVGSHVASTTYYARAKYSGSVLTSGWSTIRSYTTKDTFTQAYGVDWDPTTDTYLRTGVASGVANSTSYAGVIQSQMRRCVLNANGTVKYYLHPNDSTKKADGTAATIDGSAGNVMVEIPKFYYKYENVSGVHKWSISDGNHGPDYEVHPAFIRGGVEKDYRYYPAYEGHNLGGKLISGSGRVPTVNQTRAQFRTLAAANGTGWSQIDWNLLVAVQLLYLTEYADFNSQAMIGRGNDTGSDYTMTTGGSNSIGNTSSPSTNNDTWMSYRGIENWYASMYKFIDGVNVQKRKYFINSNPATFADDVFTGDYVDSGITSVATNGYVSNLVPNKKGFVASAVAGSNATYIPDSFSQSTGNRIVLFGGSAVFGLDAGGFCLDAYDASGAGGDIGSGVSY